jgi:hypothetical protein
MANQVYSTGAVFPHESRKVVSTRPSGLIEYSITYLVEKGAGTSSLTAGMSVGQNPKMAYPPKIISSSGSIFDEVEVVAYGLGTPSLNLQIGSETLDITATRGVSPDNYTINETWVCDVAIVVSAVTGSGALPPTPSITLNKQMIRRWLIGAPSGVVPQPISINWNTGIKNLTRNIYGDYSEVTMAFGYFPEPQ